MAFAINFVPAVRPNAQRCFTYFVFILNQVSQLSVKIMMSLSILPESQIAADTLANVIRITRNS